MRVLLLLACLALLAPARARADGIDVAKDHRVANTPGGVCLWASLETAGRHHGVAPLKGLAAWAEAAGAEATEDAVEAKLRSLGVGFHRQHPGDRNWAWVREWLAKGVPVTCSIRHWNGSGLHAVLVVEATDAKVRFIDPNTSQHVSVYTPAEFAYLWTGRAIAVPPRPAEVTAAGTLTTVAVGTPVVRPFVPAHTEERPVPSNQDIKDGVARPDDTARRAFDIVCRTGTPFAPAFTVPAGQGAKYAPKPQPGPPPAGPGGP